MKRAALRHEGMTNMTPLQPVTDQTTIVSIQGTSCGGCVNHVTSILKGLSGVSHASVDLQPGKASLDHAAAWAGEPQMIAALADAGYVARIERPENNETSAPAGASPRRRGCCCRVAAFLLNQTAMSPCECHTTTHDDGSC